MKDKIYIVKVFGTGAHIVLPTSMIGKRVKLTILKE